MNDSANIDSATPRQRKNGILKQFWSRALGRLLHLSLNETRVETRKFQVETPQVKERIEEIGSAFAFGYNHAIQCASLDDLMPTLSALPLANNGFAFEGAAMGLAITDWMTPGRRLFDEFVRGPAHAHEYMVWVGLGWSLARLPVSPLRTLRRHHSLNQWLALDGYGFHQGYFAWPRFISRQQRPQSLDETALHIFDQGLGRSMWFVLGANPILITSTIKQFDPARQADLWAGVGLAAAYAGGVDQDVLQNITDASNTHAAALAQGVVFAAQARHRAGNVVPHTELACNVILGRGLPEVAAIARDCLPSQGEDMASYQRWRLAIQEHCRNQ